MSAKKNPVWGGRFREPPDPEAVAFTESISFDRRLYRHDVRGSIAHAKMLAKQGILSASDARKIVAGLRALEKEIDRGVFRFREDLEDVHMNIETALRRRIGEVAGRLHTARSRNDQVALDLRLFVREEAQAAAELLAGLQRRLLELAEKGTGVVMPGFTHTRKAQPVLLAHYLLAHFFRFQRDRERMGRAYESADAMPLGSGALAGVNYRIDRNAVRRELGFSRLTENSLDAVSDRDFVVEYLCDAALAMVHLSSLCEELILFSSEAYGYVEIGDAFATGSSIMPQKKNPDVFELVRGKCGRVAGNLQALLLTLKGLPTAYNRDLQEDKPPLFDTADTLRGCLSIMAKALGGIRFRADVLRRDAASGYMCAVDLADYLVSVGLPFRKSHEIVGKITRYCIDQGRALSDLSLAELRRFHRAIGPEVYRCLSPESCVSAKKSGGGTSPAEVRKQIRLAKQLLRRGGRARR